MSALLGCGALTLAGCAAVAGGDDEGPEVMAALHGCNAGNPVLLPGLTLEREPDYLAEYVGGEMISAMGEACSGPQQGGCELALIAAAGTTARTATRSLITIDAEQVRLWNGPSVLTLLGRIDTPEEALLYAGAVGYVPSCDSTVRSLRAERFRLYSLGITNQRCALAISPDDGLDIYADGSVGARGMPAVSPIQCFNLDF